MTRGWFVTGTDTGVGKTVVACALLTALARRGLRTVGMKPVAAGAVPSPGGLVNDDVEALVRASSVSAPRRLVNPHCFEPPIAPHAAAAAAGVEVRIADLVAAARELERLADVLVVEGAGGLRVPLNATEDMADLARALAFPVIVVVGVRLGCINHALLTFEAVRARGLTVAGWVANAVDPAMLEPEASVQAIADRASAPLLGRIPWTPLEKDPVAVAVPLLDLARC